MSTAILAAELRDTAGLELATLLHSSQSPAPQNILMFSSPIDAESSARCKRLGIITISKPIRRLALHQALGGERRATLVRESSIVSESAAPSTGLRILLAEDNAINRHLISRILEKMGHTASAAADGKAALALLSQHEFDLIAMDMQMPVMDGIEATRILRRQELGRCGTCPLLPLPPTPSTRIAVSALTPARTAMSSSRSHPKPFAMKLAEFCLLSAASKPLR